MQNPACGGVFRDKRAAILAAILSGMTALSGCGGATPANTAGPAPGATPTAGGVPGSTNLPPGYQPTPSNPTGATVVGDRNFAALMKRFSQGSVKNMPWAGSWWPYSQDGISDAAAKYDEAQGRSGGAQAWELSHHGASLPGLQDWWGHCNGWAAAAVLFPEPKQAVSGGGVSFGVADQKALLTELAMEVKADFFGRREDDPNDFTSSVFEDVYPNQFFLVLTNYVGQGFPVVMDRYTGVQVWNQPIAGYRMDPIKPGDVLASNSFAPGGARVMVTTQLWWVTDNVEGGHLTEPFQFQDGPSYQSRTLRYEVELDAPPQFDSSGQMISSGNVTLTKQGGAVTGGAWMNGHLELANSHPDYLWIPHGVAPSTGFSNPRLDSQWIQAHFGAERAG